MFVMAGFSFIFSLNLQILLRLIILVDVPVLRTSNHVAKILGLGGLVEYMIYKYLYYLDSRSIITHENEMPD